MDATHELALTQLTPVYEAIKATGQTHEETISLLQWAVTLAVETLEKRG